MIKLLVCIFGIFGVSVCLLQLRQERLNYRYQINRLHHEIERSQGRLWNQQLKIAGATTPEALKRQILDNGGLPGGVERENGSIEVGPPGSVRDANRSKPGGTKGGNPGNGNGRDPGERLWLTPRRSTQ